jgi:SAM-dependent methyltransferase
MEETGKNITDWQDSLSDSNCPYLQTGWQGQKPFAALCLKLGEPGLWVDLGCGISYFIECCQRYGIKCEGLEGDAYAVELAQKRCPDISVKQYDITQKLPYDDASVAVVFCNQVLEHLPAETTAPFLKEVRRILKDGGLFFINMPSRYNKEQKREKQHINLMSPSELNGYLLEAGFNDIWPTNYPRFIFGKSFLAKAIAGILFFLFPFDCFCSNCSAVCFVNDQTKERVRSYRYFHLRKLFGW